MKNKNVCETIFFYGLLIFNLFISNLLFAQTNSENKLKEKAIEEGLTIYLNKIPSGHEYLYGFDSRNDFENIEILAPRKYIIINNESFESTYRNGVFYNIDRWIIPHSLNGDIICFIEMVKNKDTYKVVSFGLNELATDFSDYEKANADLNLKKPYVFIDYVRNCCCNVERVQDEYRFYPVRTLKCNDTKKNGKISYTAQEMFEILKEI